ncbi:malate dehydrogenase, mitochondrial isoform X2 [Halyomorpha halys]|uniref:malate dehydrogenase, mitochondrial isoform X2 n=1 Tax=Halyomorpha halys TaxID=286706 RepID=UPI0006D4E721|nr:malate dehydrogenase, mitochondrial-like isoform X2 [Halyomorpha halys]
MKWLGVGHKWFCGTGSPIVKSLISIQFRGLKICLLGAKGTVGQPVSLMVKQSQWFEEAALYDQASCKGLAVELNHIDTPCLVTSYEGEEGLKQALKGSNVVVNMTRSTLKPITDKDDPFADNASTAEQMAKFCAQHCPQAFHLVVTNPVNSMVPVTCETYKKVNGCVDPARIMGFTTINLLRASTFVADITQTSPDTIKVPVIGGHSENTIVPLLSKAEPCVSLTTEEKVRITRAVQSAGQEAFRALEGKTAGLSVAFGITRMVENLAKAVFDLRYFASPVVLGPTGVQKILPLPELTNYESCLLQTAIETLKKDIEKGEKYALS